MPGLNMIVTVPWEWTQRISKGPVVFGLSLPWRIFVIFENLFTNLTVKIYMLFITIDLCLQEWCANLEEEECWEMCLKKTQVLQAWLAM